MLRGGMLQRLVRATTRRTAIPTFSKNSWSTSICGQNSSQSACLPHSWMQSAMMSTNKTPSSKVFSSSLESDSDSDDEEAEFNDASDDKDNEDEPEVVERKVNVRKKRSKDLDEDDWDEERWGALDSEDWQGFTGDLDAVTPEGVPTWLQSVRDLSEIHTERKMRDKLARRAMEEAKKKTIRVRTVDSLGRAYGTGRRKTSSARVWVKRCEVPFQGRIKVNHMDLVDYFVRDTHREEILKPFSVLEMIGQFDVVCTVKGGGHTGQAGAIRHGIARALQNYEPSYRPMLKKEGFLTRDPRMVERKKAGQKKARKKFQWVKR